MPASAVFATAETFVADHGRQRVWGTETLFTSVAFVARDSVRLWISTEIYLHIVFDGEEPSSSPGRNLKVRLVPLCLDHP